MKATVGALFEAFQLVEHEEHQAITQLEKKDTMTEELRQLRNIHAVLHKALKDCTLKVELFDELGPLLGPIFKRYGLEIEK